MEMPTKTEMEERVEEHRAHRDDSDVVNLLWRGYLTALLEWELLTENDYRDVVGSLKAIGQSETRERFFTLPLDDKSEIRLPSMLELSRAVDDRIRRYGSSPTIKLLWKGYLAGLFEWTRVLTPSEYHALDDSLGDFAEDERREIFTGVNALA